jgi:light-regulated signal transduction histidine kinase (bacteriophytochrome)
MVDKEESTSPEQFDDSWNIAPSLVHDMYAQMGAIHAATQSLKYKLIRQGVRLDDEPFQYIHDCLYQMEYVLETYALILNPSWSLTISPSRISLSDVLHFAVESELRRIDNQESSHTRIRIDTGCKIAPLRLDKRLFGLALRCLLSRPISELRNSEASFINIFCRDTQDDVLLRLRYIGACVDENFRNHLFELTAKGGILNPSTRRLHREFEFTRRVITAHGGDIQVADDHHRIDVDIKLPKSYQRED